MSEEQSIKIALDAQNLKVGDYRRILKWRKGLVEMDELDVFDILEKITVGGDIDDLTLNELTDILNAIPEQLQQEASEVGGEGPN